ncbi:hypothetical protein [Cerasicoccus fimbriatus]|uniref:hypothetical protein n=1 Tax=Cerasicoccus fimbriatus TaxID=3014554 RepID=UPI0022B5CE97|nr:hypothetical protein [Cerasicoccus sp. TK19100]
MEEPLSFYKVIAVLVVLGTICIGMCIRDIIRYQLRTIAGPMIALFASVHIYGYLIYPRAAKMPINEYRFDWEIYVQMGWALALILCLLIGLMLLKKLLMPKDLRFLMTSREIAPRPQLYQLGFFVTIVYTLFFLIRKRSAIGELLTIIRSGDYMWYYEVRVQNIFDHAQSNPILNNLDSLIVGNLLMFLVGVLYYIGFKYRKFFPYYHLLLAFALLTTLIRFQKSPILQLMLLICLAYFFGRQFSIRRGFRFIKPILLTGVFLIAVVAVYVVLGFSGNIVGELHNRLFLSSTLTSYAHFWTFPTHNGFLYYGGSRLFNLVLGFGQTPDLSLGLATPPLVSSYLYMGSMFNLNTSILGTAWAQNGYAGIFIETMLFFGCFVFWDIVFARKLKRYPYEPVVIFFLMQFLVVLNNGALSLIGKGFIVIPVLYLILFRPFSGGYGGGRPPMS